MTWRMIRADEYCASVRDGTHDTPKPVDVGYKLVTGKHIKAGQIDPSDAYFISEADYEKINERSLVEQWDVIMSMIGTVGEAAIVKNVPDYAIKNVALFKCGGFELRGKWLAYYLRSDEARGHMLGNQKGSSQQFLSLKQLRSLPVPVTDEETMRRVVSILSAYDDLIENNQKQIKLLEEAAQRLYREWFVDLRFPGHETITITDGIPEGWRKDAVNSIIDLLSGFAFKSADFTDVGSYKIVTIKNVQDGMFDGHNVSRIAEVPATMPKHCYLYDGDTLLSLTGNVGRVCVVNGTDYLLNQRVAKIKSNYPAFAYCLFRSNDMFVAMGNLANGAAQQNLSPIKTGQIEILIPSVGPLARFEEIASTYMKQMLNLNKQIELLQQARDRLLPKLMSGELEV